MKTSQNSTYITLGLVGGISFLVYQGWRKNVFGVQDALPDPDPAGTEETTGKPTRPAKPGSKPTTPVKPPVVVVNGGFPLRIGSKGQYVRSLQAWLGIPPGPARDGAFGQKTLALLLARKGVGQVDSLAMLNQWIAETPGAPAPAPVPAPNPAPAPAPAPNPAYGSFPLRPGSNGQYVRNLQKLLGLNTIDGNFGQNTAMWLTDLYGKTQVNSLAELNAMIAEGPRLYTPGSVPKPVSVTPLPNSATPAPVRKPVDKEVVRQVDLVFRAIFEQYGTKAQSYWMPYSGVSLSKANRRGAIVSLLKPKSDAALADFKRRYNDFYSTIRPNIRQKGGAKLAYSLDSHLSLLSSPAGEPFTELRSRIQPL